jgi:hypothetical protein
MPMLLVACNRVRDTCQRLRLIHKVFHDHGFIFQSLVILKEAFPVWRGGTRCFSRRCGEKNRLHISAALY